MMKFKILDLGQVLLVLTHVIQLVQKFLTEAIYFFLLKQRMKILKFFI